MRRPNLRHAAFAALAIVILAAPLRAQSENTFYTTLLERGLANVKVGNWKAAAQELRIAAFGLVDDLPRYQTAHIYGAIASERLGRSDDARIAAEKVVMAERLSHAYTTLPLDPATRSTFESLLSKYVTAERLASAPAFANITSTRPSTPRPNTTFTSTTPVTTPVAPATPAPPPFAEGHDIAIRARNYWIAGDLVNAVKLATEAISLDFASGPARQVLGNIAAIERRWSDVVEHFTIARTTQRLTEDEKNKLATGFANVGRDADAAALRRTITVAPAPVTAPQPAPVTRATPPPPPPPAPQPQPQRRVIQPQPQPPQTVAPKPAPPRPTNQPRTPPPTPVEPADGMASAPRARTTQTSSAPQPSASGSAGVVRSAPSAGSSSSSSPLVNASRHSPSEAILASDPVLMLADADRLLAQGKIIAARELFARVAHLQTLNRATLLSAARGLNQTSAWRDSSASYQRAYPLEPGEEAHMFHEAVNRYELGDYPFAKELLRRALPKLPASRELSVYKSKIEAAP